MLPCEAPLLCPSCLSFMEVIQPEERCPYCFSEIGEGAGRCRRCRHSSGVLKGVASVFDYEGPAKTLVEAMKYRNHPWLSEGMAGYMAHQFFALDWPNPDFIVPVPQSFARWFERGFNQCALLGGALGGIFGVPVINPLKRKGGSFSQAGLDREQRLSLEREIFTLQNREPLMGVNLLLIDDVLTTGATLNRCGEVLLEASPSSVYALTFCSTPDFRDRM